MSIKIDFHGQRELEQALLKYGDRAEDQIVQEAHDAANNIERVVQRAYRSGTATGRAYPRTKRGGVHVASAPGQPPAADTGRWGVAIYVDHLPKEGVVGNSAEYASALEYGTRKMAARPIWRPTAEAEGKDFYQRVIDALRKVAP